MPKIFNRTWNVQFFDRYRQDRDVKVFRSFYREKFTIRKLRAFGYVLTLELLS